MKFFEIVPQGTNIDFIGKFKIFLGFSVVIGILFLFAIFTKGLNYGIDFTGGTVLQVKFADPIASDKVRDLLNELGAPEASVVSAGEKDREYLITARTEDGTKGKAPLAKRLTDKVGADKLTIAKSDVVGPKECAQLQSSAILSLVLSVLLIMVASVLCARA